VLQGGSGNEVLIGHRPNDTFVFNPNFGNDTITGFDVKHDVVSFAKTLFTPATASQVLSQTQDSAAGAVILVDTHDTVTLAGVTKAQLQASDFTFF
jgi:Ca2+-binding RTX toxin-like protein